MSITVGKASDCVFHGLRVAILTAGPSTGAKGGAERFYEGLLEGFSAIGCTAELITVPADEPTFEQILDNFKQCRELDLSGHDLVISTKVPTYAARHPNHVLYLVHTVRVFDDMFGDTFHPPMRDHFVQRARLHQLDFAAIQGVKARFAIGQEVARRLYRWRGLDCEVLHPPLGFNGFRKGRTGDYFFLPGRLHPWKRVDLVIEAIRHSTLPLKFVIAGTGEAENELKRLAAGDERIQFVGRIDDHELVELYANALAVPFVPLREDYGYVTLEAFASGKPVITCTDSGEPACLIRNFESGLIASPDPDSLRRTLEWLFNNRDKAARMGENGSRLIENMSWKNTATILAQAGTAPSHRDASVKSKVTVLDMQPIDPPVGGGRLRLLGLYHNLGKHTECRYVGTYDWPGERYRAHALSETLFEIDVPLSDAHHAAAADLARQAGGKVVIDLAFSQQGTLSPDYVETARKEMADADVVVFSHPWVYPLVKDCLRPDQVVVYDSQNVEGFLRAQLLNEKNPVEAALLRQVAHDENEVGRRADWILACSHEDLLRFHRIYGFSPEKMRVVPNGVMAFNGQISTPDKRREARQAMGIAEDAFVAIFIGSGYGPNIEAAKFIDQAIATVLPRVTFVIAGGVGMCIDPSRKNVIKTCQLDDAAKFRWFHAADIAINPMLSGSGTNIKMFDFMAMGLPVVSTAVGARGIETAGRQVMLIAEPNPASFAAAIGQLMEDESVRNRIGREGRMCVEDGYAWERISEQLGTFLMARKRLAGQPRPLFSVVVPTYERHDQLGDLIGRLQKQIERDFEVILVDQSAARWEGAKKNYGFPLVYFHSPVKGAVRARNTGAMLAQGSIIAFVDDDCLPSNDWLLNARPYFDDSEVVGLEGLIESDHHDDPDYRPVTNVNFQGIGFMTANLMVRSSVFQYLGGIDLQFDRPHFREDTDFGWRMQDIGRVPHASDVAVFHPAQPRNKERESSAERAKFFQKDALLYRKHPERYRELFMAEQHFSHTAGFSENLVQGFEANGIPIPEWIASKIQNPVADTAIGLQSERIRIKHSDQWILHEILKAFDGASIGLPAPSGTRLATNEVRVKSLMRDLEASLGEAANTDYFKCSRERFSHVVNLALRHVQSGGRLLDIGNAPGYLAMALYKAGYSIDGINLSDAWNSTYPDSVWLKRFKARSVDIEHNALPFEDGAFDGLVFTEVLEHIAITHPAKIVPEFKRVLKPGGVVLFSTPNVCNLSNLIALATGSNVFWQPEIFYGSIDRHNREYTPKEVRRLFRDAGFEELDFYGINDHANWRTGAVESIYSFLGSNPIGHPLLRNTIIAAYRAV